MMKTDHIDGFVGKSPVLSDGGVRHSIALCLGGGQTVLAGILDELQVADENLPLTPWRDSCWG